jgi:hypothetical protein
VDVRGWLLSGPGVLALIQRPTVRRLAVTNSTVV